MMVVSPRIWSDTRGSVVSRTPAEVGSTMVLLQSVDESARERVRRLRARTSPEAEKLAREHSAKLKDAERAERSARKY